MDVVRNEAVRDGIWPAGWPLRHFSIEQLEALLVERPPRLLEISKEFPRDAVSLKVIARTLDRVRAEHPFAVAYAGTTDLVACSGFSWDRYRDYLAVQIAEARFLESSMFRVLVGEPSPHIDMSEVTRRMALLCSDLAPMTACVEIHGGIESDPAVLTELLRTTPIQIVVDFENMYRAGLTSDQLLELVPADRLAYVHQRNLAEVWVEHETSLADEMQWRALFEDTPFLWEPKAVETPEKVRQLFREYHS